jgi:peptide/nickel transport system permease protein
MDMSEQRKISLSIPSQRFDVAPGQRLKIPVSLMNKGSQARECTIRLEGIPDGWISKPFQAIRVAPVDPMTIELILTPPRQLKSKVEFYRLKIILNVENAPEETISTEASLMLGKLTLKDNLGVLAASSNYSISAGEIVHVPLFLINLGNISEQFMIKILGLVEGWYSLSETQFSLAPGERKRVLVTLHPPRAPECRAGRHAFSIEFMRLSQPEQPVTMRCTLTVAAFAELKYEPDHIEMNSGQAGRLLLTNPGNIPQTCQVTLHSGSLEIDLAQVQQENPRILPGQSVGVEFKVAVRQRNWFGGARKLPFEVHVLTSERETIKLAGEVISSARIPIALPEGLIATINRFRHWLGRVNWPLLIGGMIMLLMLILAIKGPDLALQDPLKENYAIKVNGQISRPPYPPFTIPGYPLGTDNFGRDLLSRILWGIRPTIVLVVTVAFVRLVLGNLIGLLAGFSNGRMGKLLEGLVSAALSIPVLIVALMGITAVGIRRGLIAFIIGLALTGWADTARFVSTRTKIIKHQTFVEAARGLGASDFRILAHHIWKQLAPLLGMLFAFEISSTLFVIAELGFLGYFIGGGTWIEVSDFVVTNAQGFPELGQLLSSALVTLVKPTVLVIVGTAIFFGILGFNLLGEGLRVRANRQVASASKLRKLFGEQLGVRIDERYPLSATDWMERHAVVVLTVLAILLISTGWLVWQNTRPVKTTLATNETILTVPGGQLWATEKHDAQGTYWISTSGPQSSDVAWRYQAPGGFTGGPVVLADGTGVISTRDQQLIALDTGGQMLWQVQLSVVPVASPAAGQGGEIYVSGEDGSLLAFSPEGEALWQFTPKNKREASSGPIVDSRGNIFYTQVDTIQAVTPDGKSKWAAYASDVYAEQPPVLSAGESYIFLLDKALAAENGFPLNLDGLPVEELKFTAPQFFVGADQATYLRSGHEIYQWKSTETGIEVQPPITWPYEDYVVLPPIEQGVTPDGMAWMFYASDYNDTRMVWLDKAGKLIDNSRLQDRQSRLIGIDRDLIAYICSNNYKANVSCGALKIGDNKPLWTIDLGENVSVVGGALVPGRMYIALDAGALVAVGTP